ncbi:MAG: TolC family protein [Deltaproteobacteria bacterium]|nr:TolC family protein [Deltaproteobacteria bacterium]
MAFCLAARFTWAEEKESLSLETLLSLALQENPQLKSIQAQGQAEGYRSKAESGLDDPEIGIRFYQVPLDSAPNKAMDIDYILRQKIPFPGKRNITKQMIQHETLHHLERLDSKQREIISKIKQNFFSLFATKKMQQTNLAMQQTLQSLNKNIENEISAGKMDSSNYFSTLANISQLKIEEETLRQRETELIANLRTLCADKIEDKISLPQKLEKPYWKVKVEELLEYAKTEHPELKLASHEIGKKELEIRAAKKSYAPDFSVQLEYIQHPQETTEGQKDAWTSEFMMSVPLWSKKNSSQVKKAQAELAAAQYDKINIQNEVNQKIRQSYSKFQSAQKTYEIVSKSLLSSLENALTLSQTAYSAGKASFSSVLENTQKKQEAQIQQWKAFEEWGLALANLEEASGITQEEWNEKTKPIKTKEPL